MKNKILVVVSHSDDEVLGCGGTIAKHISEGDEVFVLVLTDGESSRAEFNIAKRHQCLEKACHTLGVKSFYNADFKDSQMDTHPLVEIVRKVEQVASEFKPTIVYTHSETDLNIDHTVTNRAVMTAFRGVPGASVSKILAFEIPSSTEWGNIQNRFTPNYFVELSDQNFATKLEAMKCYPDEMRDFPHPRSTEYLSSLAKIRGGSVGVKLAEAFSIERIIVRSEPA